MWKFQQSTGGLFGPEGTLMATGYAGGNLGRNPEGKNNPHMQFIKNVGPLPQGRYSLGEPVEHATLGPFAIPLIPDPANNMGGRGDFYCHGDTTPPGNASEGCIVMPRSVRDLMWASDDHQLEVIQ
jgi:hypothetical protein